MKATKTYFFTQNDNLRTRMLLVNRLITRQNKNCLSGFNLLSEFHKTVSNCLKIESRLSIKLLNSILSCNHLKIFT